MHPMKISRLVFPQNTAFSTPPHQDFVPIQGTTDTYTCWIPLGDCPREHGGLTVRAGSHQSGVYELHLTRGAWWHGDGHRQGAGRVGYDRLPAG